MLPRIRLKLLHKMHVFANVQAMNGACLDITLM